jgi:hypothetical protein
METLFVLLYWPVVGVLILFVSRLLLRKGVGPWWNFLLVCLPLWALSVGVLYSVIGFLHLHGRLLQIVGFIASQHVDGFYQFLYTFWMANCFYVSTEPVFRRLREDWRKKKATKAALAGGE